MSFQVLVPVPIQVFLDWVQMTFFKGLQFGSSSVDLPKNYSKYLLLSPPLSSVLPKVYPTALKY